MELADKKQSGMILILSILIISAVLATAAVFGNLIIREIRFTRLIDQSIQAYYLAESGAERALYQVRILEGVTDCSPGSCQEDTGQCSTSPEIPCLTVSQGSLSQVVGDWQVAVSQEEQTAVVLAPGDTFQIDLFSPNQVQNANITKIDIGSSIGELNLLGELTNLTNILQVGGDLSPCSNQPPVFKDRIAVPTQLPRGALDGKDILAACSYVFRLRYPLIDDSADESLITLKVYNDLDQQVAIPSRLIISSAATFGSSLQTVTVRTPMRPPLSGLYDFVLFSEQKIVK